MSYRRNQLPSASGFIWIVITGIAFLLAIANADVIIQGL